MTEGFGFGPANSARLAQRVHRRLLEPETGGSWDRMSRAAAAVARRWLINRGDPAVHYRFEGTTLLLPLSHELPYYRWRFPDYSRNIGRIAAQLHGKRREALTIVDIGANVGDTLAIIRRQVPSPVLCIEPDRLFVSLLRENAKSLGPAVVEQSLVGRAGEMVSMVVSASGTASIGQLGDTAVMKAEPLPTILARNPPFEGAGLVKVDTDGYDSQVLLGAARWLKEQQPVLFFEHDPDLEQRVTGVRIDAIELLYGLGYRYISIFSNEGDYVVSFDNFGEPRIQDILHYFSGRSQRRYCDIAAYAERDADVWSDVRVAEARRL